MTQRSTSFNENVILQSQLFKSYNNTLYFQYKEKFTEEILILKP